MENYSKEMVKADGIHIVTMYPKWASDKVKKFKEFLENYDFYIDKPMGFKKPDTSDEIEQTTDEDTAQEENANEVRK
jgi:hypothetical protein